MTSVEPLDGSIEERLRRIEARLEIGDLVARYAQGADRRNDPQLLGPLFSDDATWSAEGFATIEGSAAIAAGLAAIAADRVVWSIHYMLSPLITLTPDCRKGLCRWYLWELCSMRDGGESKDQWLGGWYDAEVSCTKSGWRFCKVVLDIRLQGDANPPWSLKKPVC